MVLVPALPNLNNFLWHFNEPSNWFGPFFVFIWILYYTILYPILTSKYLLYITTHLPRVRSSYRLSSRMFPNSPNFASFSFRRYLCRSFHFRFLCIAILNLVHVFFSPPPLPTIPFSSIFFFFPSLFRCDFLPFRFNTPDFSHSHHHSVPSFVARTTQQVNLGQNFHSHATNTILTDCSDLNFNDTMTCQELLAFSVAFSAALPTNQNTLDTFYTSLAQHDTNRSSTQQQHQHQQQQDQQQQQKSVTTDATNNCSMPPIPSGYENFACCYHLYQHAGHIDMLMPANRRAPNKFCAPIIITWRLLCQILSFMRRYVKVLVDHKYFQQGILLAILINTLSMGIEYHDQPAELTVIVETSNIVFSGIFAIEMLLKVIAEGPFRYIANGFNVFDGVIVILR